VKFAPLRNSERASATAAYEHEEDAAPSASAVAIERGRSSGSSRLISLWETTACTTAESKKPRINGHRISHPMARAMANACVSASIIGCSDDANYGITQPGSDRFGSSPISIAVR
jgi:hypothetical protein